MTETNARRRIETTESTPLTERLHARIDGEGAISFADWMQAALYDEREGYYCRADLTRWGRAGDYRTSSERSPLFAATFAHYFATLHQQLGSPQNWTLIEAGAGAGDFASVVLETLRRAHPHIFQATRYLIDEQSAASRTRAIERLSVFSEQVRFQRLSELNEPLDACLIFSNELFDAMPVHRVVKRGGKLRELCVGWNSVEGAFAWVEREPTTLRLYEHLARFKINPTEGQIIEINLNAEDWIHRAARIIKRGYVVTVDYGAEADELYGRSQYREGTLRGFRGHRFAANILGQAGEQDLTTTINWTQLREAGEEAGLQTVLLERQDQFLLRAGLLEQLEILSVHANSEAEKMSLRLSAREMILPNSMSQSFQVLVQSKL